MKSVYIYFSDMTNKEEIAKAFLGQVSDIFISQDLICITVDGFARKSQIDITQLFLIT